MGFVRQWQRHLLLKRKRHTKHPPDSVTFTFEGKVERRTHVPEREFRSKAA